MKNSRICLIIVNLLLVIIMIFNVTGCAEKISAEPLMKDIEPNVVKATGTDATQNEKITDFAVRLFKASQNGGENTLVSPLSVICALAMTANGAKNETLAEMENVLGMNRAELNSYLHSYVENLPQGEKYKLCLANSIWFNEDTRFTVNQNFLQTNADYYGADVYKAPFNDKTCKDINNWVKEKTDGLIPDILDEIPAEAVMYLVNALAFEAEWNEPYSENAVSEGKFTLENGTVKTTEFMYGTESRYFEDERATGFMKYYSGGKYAFVALLPNEGISIEEYVSSLSGKALNNLLSTPTITTVNTAIPKFETEYKTDMAGVLKKMGMPSAFDPKQAELSGLGTSSAGNLFISRVLHKTFISVAEKGTKAGAATVVEIMDEGCVSPDIPEKQVFLNRPFVYMLVDCENNVPFFIGTTMDVGK